MTSYTWNVDADGNWATDQNWGQTGAPEAGGDVTINTTDFHTINFGNNGGAATVDTLTVGNDLLVLADGSLTINKTASFASGLTFGGGVLDMAAGSKVTVAGGLGGGGYGVIAGTGTMTVTGTADLSNLTQTDFNTVILQNASKIDGGYTLQDGAFLENQNSLSFIGGRLTFGQGTIQNDATGQIDIVSDFQFFNAGGTNSFLNYGTIDRYVTSGIAEIQAPTYNTGIIEIDTGTLNFDGGGTFVGTLPARSFDDTIGGAGTLELGGGNWTIDSGTIFNVANWTIDGGSTVTLAENTTYDGNFTLAQGASLNVVQGLTLTLTGKVDIQGAITGTGTVAVAGTTSLANNETVTGGQLATTSTGTIQVTAGTSTIDASTTTFNNPGSLVVGLSTSVGLEGTIDNQGTITVAGADNYAGTALVINADVTLTGNGKLVLTDSGTNQILAATNGLTLNNVNNTIIGAGQLGAGTQLTLMNGGTIDADDDEPLNINLGGNTLTNSSNGIAGFLEATGTGGLSIYNTTVVGGTIQAVGVGAHVDISSATIAGATLTESSGGLIQANSTTLDGTASAVTINGGLTVELSTNVSLRGNIVNKGTISLVGQDNNGATNLVIDSALVTLTGNGSIVLSDSGTNQIYAGTGNNVLDNTAGSTISGAGQIGAGTQLTLDNESTIDANQTEALTINLGGNTLTNTGTLEDTNTGGLVIYNSVVTGGTLVDTGTGGLSISTTTVDGATIQSLVAGSHIDLNSATITGSTLTTSVNGVIQTTGGSSTIDSTKGVFNNAGSLTVGLSTNLSLLGTVNNTGTITLAGQDNNATTNLIVASDTVTLTGHGKLVLSDSGTNQIYTAVPNNALDNVDNTISGAGQIGAGTQLTLNNGGTIDADQDEAININLGANTLTNTGTLEDTGTGGLSIYNTTVAGGTIQAMGAGAHVDISTVTIVGATLSAANGGLIQANATTLDGSTTGVTINGGLTVELSANVSLRGTIDNKGTISLVGQDNNATTNLVIDSPLVTLTGNGSIVLSDSGTNQIYGNATTNVLDNTAGSTISGAGQVGAGSLTLDNEGTINANQTDALTINTGGNTLTNTGTIEDTSTGGLVIYTTTVEGGTLVDTGTGGLGINTTTVDGATIQSLVAGSHIDLSSATITDSTLTTSANGVIQTTGGSSTIDSTNGVFNNAGQLTVGLSTNLTLLGTVNNTGTITIAGQDNNATTNLIVGSETVTLMGHGKLVLSDSGTNQIYTAVPNNVLDNVDNTISGAGQIGAGTQLTLNNGGTIDADQDQALSINLGGNTLTNTGTLEATGTGGLSIYNTTVSGGLIQALVAKSNVSINTATITGATLATANGGLIETNGSTLDGSANAINITGSGLTVETGTALTLRGTIGISGTLNLAGADNNATTNLIIDSATVTLTGGGALVLTDSGTNQIYGSSSSNVLDNTAGNTISGAGQLGAASLTLDNEGTINANQTEALTINTGANALTNTGIIEATGAGGLAVDSTVNGGTIQALVAASHIDLNGGTIADGAKLATANGGVIQTGGTAALDGTASAVNNTGALLVNTSNTLTLLGTINNTGTITLSGADNNATTNLIINSSTVTLKGGGSLILSDSTTNQVYGASGDDVLDNAVGSTIIGAGALGADQLTLDNEGTINANQDKALTINTGPNALTNIGIIEDTGTGGLAINSTVNGGTIQALVVGSHIDLNGGTIGAGATLATANGGVIQTGGTGTLDGSASAVNNTGAVLVNLSNALNLLGAIDNTGTISLAGMDENGSTNLVVNSSLVTLTGNGSIVLSDSATNEIYGTSADDVLDNAGNTITGAGQLGAGQLTLTNGGTINANQSEALTINTGDNAVTNTGTIEATGAGGLIIQSTTVNGGTLLDTGAGGVTLRNARVNGMTIDALVAGAHIDLDNGAIVGGTLATANGGVIQTVNGVDTLDGSASAVTNTGAVLVKTETTLDLLGTIKNSGTITVDGTVEETGNVVLSAGGLANQTDGTWNAAGGFGISVATTGTGTFTNAGNFAKGEDSGTATMGISFTDTGAVAVLGGKLSFTGATNSFAGDISGDGTVEFGGTSQSALNTGTTIETAAWTIDSAAAKVLLNTSLSYEGAFALLNGGTMTIAAGKTLTLTDGSTFNGALVNGAGTLITGGMVLATGALTVGGTVTWQNNGIATLTGALTLGDNTKNKVVLTNGAKGSVNIIGANGINLGGSATSVFQNLGLLAKTSNSGTSHIKIDVVDTGTITVTQGTLEFDGAANSFAGKINGGGTIAFGGGTNTLNAGIGGGISNVLIANKGTQVVLNTSINLLGNVTQQANTTVTLGNNALGLNGANSVLAGTIGGSGASSALGFLAGTVTLNAGFKLLTQNWGLNGGVKVIDNVATGDYDGTVLDGASTLTIVKTSLTLTGAVTFAGSTVDGGSLKSLGATKVQGLTLGGGIQWMNSRAVTETVGVTIGDAAGKTATITNAVKSAVYNLTANVGIALAKGASGSFVNFGTLEKTAGTGTSTVALDLVNSHAVIVSAGTLDLSGNVTGTGTMNITKKATLELDGAVVKTQTVAFGTGGGTLALSHAATFAGLVSGFSGATDVLDLAGFDTKAKKSFTENAQKNGGTLTITEGALKASIALFGQYVASGFKLATDHAGGVDVTYTPPKAAHADLAPHH